MIGTHLFEIFGTYANGTRLTPTHNRLLHFWFCSSAPLQSADRRNAVEERRKAFSRQVFHSMADR